jgi:hypothetical protein
MAGHEILDTGVEAVLPLDNIGVQIHGVEIRLQIEWMGRRDAKAVKSSFPAAGILFPGWRLRGDFCCLNLDGLVSQQLSADAGGDLGSIGDGVWLWAAAVPAENVGRAPRTGQPKVA